MKHLFFKITLLLFLVFALVNCITSYEPKDQLPPITQTGENTFGCIVDGKVFIPKDYKGYNPPGGGTPRGLSILGNSRTFVIQATNYQDIYMYIYIPEDIPRQIEYNFQNSPGVEYSLNEPNHPHTYGTIYSKKYLSYENSGSIMFSHVDNTLGIYSGVFNIKLKNKDSPTDIIEITNGRFDINLATLNN